MGHQINASHVAAIARFVIAKVGEDKKIECIKQFRMMTGLSLKESKDMVEAALPPQRDPVLAYACQITGESYHTHEATLGDILRSAVP